jgi:hypothetical protein
MKQMIKNRTYPQYVDDMKLLGVLTNNMKEIAHILRQLDIDKKYNTLK